MPPAIADVIKRDGTRAPVSFDQILQRYQDLSWELDVDVVRLAQKVVQGLYPDVRTSELDDLAAETAAALASRHPDYGRLAGRVAVSNLQKQTEPSMRAVFDELDPELRDLCERHIDEIDGQLDWQRDFRYDYLGFKTLEKSYLTRDRASGRIVERPQVLFMRVALGIHRDDLDAAFETYSLMSTGVFTHATPTMFNAGTNHGHLASCFLLPVEDDSISGIYGTLKTCAEISKAAGGIGVSVSNVRAQGTVIQSTGGRSSGLVPMLQVFDKTARYVDQGGGKRKGAFAAYLEPWHADVRAFLDLKKNHGQEEFRARDLFYALWIPDIFMRRVEADAKWTLMCPTACPELVDLWGEAFDERYEQCEREGKGMATVAAQELWLAIIDAQIETGTPYMLYKDACNAKSNQQHLGTIRSSNLCTEIVQFSSRDEIAVCNLASIALPACVREDATFDHQYLARIARIVTNNLNCVIDRNQYAREEARRSNARHRPIGIGVQGLADVFALMDLPFDSTGARTLNRDIFETIYHASLSQSCSLAAADGPHASFAGSPAAEGRLQFDLWGVAPPAESIWDWAALKERIAQHGLRNSLLVAPMPTASTAQILGNNECFEPFTSNLYARRVLSGEHVVVNRHLVRRLEALGMWTDAVRMKIVADNGSVQAVDGIPDHVKSVFRTAWELKMRSIIEMAADRAPYIDQSQSLNLFVAKPTHGKVSAMHMYAWRRGLKTGMYYLRTRPAADAVKTTVPVDLCRARDRVDDEPPCASCTA